MSENSRFKITWTPSSAAVSQKLYRSLSNTGPWTLIATLGPTVDSYTDSSVDPTPADVYYYKLDTICSNGNSETAVVFDTAINCDSNGKTRLFGLVNNATETNNILDFTYYDTLSLFANTYYSASTSYPKTITVDKTDPIVVVCQKCGQDVTYSLNATSASFGATQTLGDYSYLSTQGHIIKYLPTSPTGLGGSSNNNAGTVRQKLYEGTLAPVGGRFQLGVGNTGSNTWVGWGFGYVSANANTSVATTNLTWNYGEMPSSTSTANGGFTGIRISKADWDGNSPGTEDFSSALAQLTGSNWYVSILDSSNLVYVDNTAYGGLSCEHHIYKLTRKSAWDYVVNGVITHYGFIMQRYSYVDYNGYRIYSSPIRQHYFPYTAGQQPDAYLKIFSL